MMLISTILLSVVGLLAVEGANNCPGLKVTSPNTDEQNVDVNCTLLGTSSCRDPTNIPSHLLGSEFVGQPDFFEVVSDRTVPKGIADYLPRMNMTWRPAISGGDLRNLKGFLIYFHRLTPGTSSVLCRILDLHESKFSEVKTTFNFLLEKMRAETLYLVQIYGLPRPRNSNLFPDVRRQSFVYTQPRSGDNYEQRPKDWKSSISYQMDEEAGVINATFRLAPHHLNFTKYEVKLLDGNDILKSVRNKTVLQTDFMYGKVGFENVPAGNYSVSVQAVDVYFSDMSKCLCYSVEKSAGSRLCSQCLVSMTPPFVFNSSLGSPVPSPSSES